MSKPYPSIESASNIYRDTNFISENTSTCVHVNLNSENIKFNKKIIESQIYPEKSGKSLEAPKWLNCIMFLICTILSFGNLYVYNMPQALQTPFEEDLGIKADKTNTFYAAYGIPNTFLAFFTGSLVNMIGKKKSLILAMVLMVAGQLLFSYGILVGSYWIMLIGRVIFGLGGENIIVVQFIMINRWFRTNYLSAANGFCCIFNSLGLTTSSYVIPKTYVYFNGDYIMV